MLGPSERLTLAFLLSMAVLLPQAGPTLYQQIPIWDGAQKKYIYPRLGDTFILHGVDGLLTIDATSTNVLKVDSLPPLMVHEQLTANENGKVTLGRDIAPGTMMVIAKAGVLFFIDRTDPTSREVALVCDTPCAGQAIDVLYFAKPGS